MIILSIIEHHANIVPWHFLRERLGGAEMGRGRCQGRLIQKRYYDHAADQADCTTHMSMC